LSEKPKLDDNVMRIRSQAKRRTSAIRTKNVIGLIPCGGNATRIGPLPCSKEMFPVGLRRTDDGSLRPRVVSHDLLEKMRLGGVRKAFFILRSGKWDIPGYYRDGDAFGLDVGYLIMGLPYGAAYTLDQAYPFVQGARIAFGFPDILLGPSDAFERALTRLKSTGADLVLGLFRMRRIQTSDMVCTKRTGEVRELVIKPNQTKLKLGWMFAVWTPVFTEYLHDYLTTPRTAAQKPGTSLPQELTVGHVIQAAVRAGVRTQSVTFRGQHTYLDIGTPEGLRQMTTGFGAKWSRELKALP
jgi:glucose-1-phosphate thymidylyltransferase